MCGFLQSDPSNHDSSDSDVLVRKSRSQAAWLQWSRLITGNQKISLSAYFIQMDYIVVEYATFVSYLYHVKTVASSSSVTSTWTHLSSEEGSVNRTVSVLQYCIQVLAWKLLTYSFETCFCTTFVKSPRRLVSMKWFIVCKVSRLIQIQMSARSVPKCCGFIVLSARVISPSIVKISRWLCEKC